MIDGDIDVSYIVTNTCIVFGTTCASVNPAKLFVLLAIWPPTCISGAHSCPTKSEVPLLEHLTPENTGVAVRIMSLCALELEICRGHFYPSRPPPPPSRCRQK